MKLFLIQTKGQKPKGYQMADTFGHDLGLLQLAGPWNGFATRHPKSQPQSWVSFFNYPNFYSKQRVIENKH